MKFKTSDFDFNLPSDLIAQYPLPERTASRLMVVPQHGSVASIEHKIFADIVDLIESKDLLIFNNTKVIPARLYGQKISGGKIECLIERIISPYKALAHIRSSKSPNPGIRLILENAIEVVVCGRQEALFEIEFPPQKTVLEWLDEYGHIPLPPYVAREAEKLDQNRYQTVYAKQAGAVAAPTAGLHFDENILQQLRNKNVPMAELTLHVGAGTFQPVRSDDIRQHHMHSEWLSVSEEVCQAINACKARGGRVIAVGTTVVRSLETAAQKSQHSYHVQPYQGDTDIFIYPGYQFQVVDALITNFHLPKSTLLMLICAFGSYDTMMAAYQQAVEQKYRFFSYGDAMFIK